MCEWFLVRFVQQLLVEMFGAYYLIYCTYLWHMFKEICHTQCLHSTYSSPIYLYLPKYKKSLFRDIRYWFWCTPIGWFCFSEGDFSCCCFHTPWGPVAQTMKCIGSNNCVSVSRIQDLLSKTWNILTFRLCFSVRQYSLYTCFFRLKNATNSQKTKKTAASSSCLKSAGIIWDAPGHVPGSLRFGASTYRCRGKLRMMSQWRRSSEVKGLASGMVTNLNHYEPFQKGIPWTTSSDGNRWHFPTSPSHLPKFPRAS